MGSTAAIVAAALLVVLIGFQIGLALGAPWGKLAWGGRHRILPAPLRMGSGLSIVIYALIALILLSRADVVQVFGATAATVLTWIVTGYLVIGIGLNMASRSRAERAVMTPVAAVLAGLSLVVAVG